ncbi:phosphomannomutase/phosphoglucomutase [Halanaerobium salsuginis]|jgi:phosphomannomutase|uniref:Phosphomannomutase n=1 Tax=Halanaerobium salsuginis TaxID=29563 RepID=A0A1I4HRY7_9FIRM|nr:phosphomannomutase/phosphoglucomutase [Halanaerobium salsuginis]SFL44814.1 Phosphomannomutase [Halanaerobium salsuginis]
MQKINWLELRSGTDIRGRAIAESAAEINLSAVAAVGIGYAFAKWLAEKKSKPVEDLTIAIGHDSRLSAANLKNALAVGIKTANAAVSSAGLASTPAMFMATILDNHQYDGSIMITASHLPADKNGFKFFTKDGGLEKEDITAILNYAADHEIEFEKIVIQDIEVNLEKINLMTDYAVHIQKIIRKNLSQGVDTEQPLADFKIIVDAGNGAGGFFVKEILDALGADTAGSQFLEPDGNFPNHIPNPEDETAMRAIKQAVIANQADLGIIFDTDVDRAAVVAGNGKEINRNRLIALASAIVLQENPGATIVTDSVTSVGLKKFIENKLGGVHHRFKRGYKNVINEAKRLESEGTPAPLAIETSGHAAFRDNYFLDDGAYLVAKILIKMANLNCAGQHKIEDLISDLEEAAIKKEYRLKITEAEFKGYGAKILNKLDKQINKFADWQLAPNNYQGLRVNCGGNDWFLMRMSLHDPVVVINIECDSNDSLKLIKDRLEEFLAKFSELNSTKLN